MSKPRAGRPTRRIATRRARTIIKLVCEGSVTEPEYFAMLDRLVEGVRVVVDSKSGRDPLALVMRAAELDTQNQRSRRTAGELDHDEIWCVFDVDDHTSLATALDAAQRTAVRVAASNPCFELWLLLHHGDQTAPLTCADAARRCVDAGLTRGKHVQFVLTLDGVRQAIERGRGLDSKHQLDGSPSGSNPSTGVAELVERIISATCARTVTHVHGSNR